MSEQANSSTRRWASLAAATILLALCLVLVGSHATAAQPPTVAPSRGASSNEFPSGMSAPRVYPWESGIADTSPGAAPQQAEYDLGISKWKMGPGYARPGGVFVYGIYYRMDGDGVIAEDVTVVDTLPPDTSYAGDTSGLEPELSGNTITWNLGALEPGDRGVIILTVDVASTVVSGTAIAENCVTIESSTLGDWDPENNGACTESPVDVWDDAVDLSVDKWADPGDPAPGQLFRYVVNPCNNRGAAAGPVVLTDTLPAGTTLVDWWPQEWWQVLWSEVSRSDGQLVLEAAGLPGDWCQEIVLSVELDAEVEVGTTLENLVEITVADDENLEDNWRLHNAQVGGPRPDLAVDKWFNTGSLAAGGWVEYGIGFWNQGNVAVDGGLIDTLPTDTDYIADSSSMNGEPFVPEIVTSDQVVWDLGTIGVSEYREFSFRVQIDPSVSEDILTNCVEVGHDQEESTPQDNERCLETQIFESGPNLHVQKWSEWQYNLIYYSIFFANFGDEVLSTVQMTDTYPVGTSPLDPEDWMGLPGHLTVTVSSDHAEREWLFEVEEMQPGDAGWIDFWVEVDAPDARPAFYTNTVEIDLLAGDDVNPSDNVYTDVIGLGEVERVELWMEPDGNTDIWGGAIPGVPVTVTLASGQFTTTAGNDECPSCWSVGSVGVVNEGDRITVTADSGLLPVVFEVPDPLTATVDSGTDQVWGRIGGWLEQPVEVHGEWENGYREVATDGDGFYQAVYPDVPPGARGYVRFVDSVNYADVIYHRVFVARDLILQVNYDHEWVQGNYEPGHTVWITVTESDGTTEKATAELTTQQVPEWGGFTGFSTDLDDPWDPERPDLQPGDWVYARASTGYTATVQIGLINGWVDAGDDSISGNVHADWLLADEVDVECHSWGAPEGAPNQWSTAGPDGDPPYFCQWDPLTEWDLLPGQQVAVSYYEPAGHQVFAVFEGPWMRVNYGGDWVGGNYAAGATFHITVTNEAGTVVKGVAEVESTPWQGWGGPGFETWDEHWLTGRPDIEPLDWVHFRSNDGYEHAMQVGTITGEVDVAADSVGGQVFVPWFVGEVEELDVECHPWGSPDPVDSKNSTAGPNGDPPYTCDWSAEWDIRPGQEVAVMYVEPDDLDRVINVFREPAPDMSVQKSPAGHNEFTAPGYAVFEISYRNEGDAIAETVSLVDTLPPGTTYEADSSGVDADYDEPAGTVTWQVGPVAPGDEGRFFLVIQIVPDPDPPASLLNQVDIWTEDDSGDWNNHGEAEIYLAETPGTDIWVNKWPDPGNPAAGSTFVYQIDYGNNGNVATGPVTLVDTLPPDTHVVGWYSEQGYDLWTETGRNGQLSLEADTLPAGWSDRIVLRLSIESDVPQDAQLVNRVELDISGSHAEAENGDAWVSGPDWNAYLDKRFGSGRLVPGGEASYNLHLRSNGNMTVTATLTDILPAGTFLKEAWIWDGQNNYEAPPAQPDSSTLVWDLGELAPAEYRNLNLTLGIEPGVAAGTVLTNCAQVSILEGDSWPYDNERCAVETVRTPGPNLRVLKDYWWNGDGQLQYEITFQNIGTQDLYGVVMTDTLPSGTSFNGNWWPNFWEPVTLTHESPGELAWEIRRIDPGWSANINFQADLDGVLVGVEGLSYTNLVEAPVPEDVWPEDNYDEVTAYTGPDIFVEKWLSGGEPRPGEIVTFTIKFGNANRSPWSGDGNVPEETPPTTIADTLPEAMTFITATAPWDPEQGWQPYDIVDNTIYWGLWPMWSDSWWQFDVVAQITDTVGFGDVLTNTVEAWSNSITDIDPLPDNNIAKLRLTILAPDLAVSKTYDTNRVAGTLVTYTLSVANDGNAEATGVVLSDTLPAGLTFVDSDGSLAGGDVTWSLAVITAGGGTAEGWFSAELPCQAGVSIANDTYGVVSSDQGVAAWGEAVSFTTVAPTIQVSLDHSPKPALVDEAVSFVATAASNGTGLAYEWDFGGGPVSGGLTNSYTFAEAGSYEVSFTATDACGFSQEAVTTVQVEEGLHTVYLPVVIKNH